MNQDEVSPLAVMFGLWVAVIVLLTCDVASVLIGAIILVVVDWARGA